MAFAITVGGNDLTAYVPIATVDINEVAARVATATFQCVDDGAALSIAIKDAVVIDDGATTYFKGEVAASPETQEIAPDKLIWYIECQDYNQLLGETVVTTYSAAAGTKSDSTIVDDLVSTFRGEADIDSTTYVSTIIAQADMEDYAIKATSLAEALTYLCRLTGARFYVDFDKNLHYYASTANVAAVGLSDSYDGATTFRYWNLKREGCVNLANAVYIEGLEVTGWVIDATSVASYGSREIAIKDDTIATADAVTQLGNSILDANKNPKVRYTLLTQRGGFVAGQKVQLTSSVYSLSAEELLITEIQTTFLTGSKPICHLKIGADILDYPMAQIVIGDQIGIIDGRIGSLDGSVYDTDAPAAPVLETANLSTGVSIDADGHQIVWIQITWASVGDGDLAYYQVQMSTSSDFSAYTITRDHPADGSRIERFDGMFGSLTHYFRVRAIDWVGNCSAWSTTRSISAAADSTPPANPSGVTGLATPVSCHIYWTANSEADLSHYVIQRKAVGGSYATIATASLNFFIDNTVTMGTSYLYQVAAVDTSGNASSYVEIGSAVTPDAISGGYTDLTIQGWGHDLAFSATDHNTVTWASGTITMGDGTTTYSIDAGNTGDMSATTYIYLDTGTSETVLQTTATAGTAVGANKLLVAVAKNVASGRDAQYQVFGGAGDLTLITAGQIAANIVTANEIYANTITAAEIAAATITGDRIAGNTVTATQIAVNTITAAEIAATTITATEMNVSQLSAIAADLGTITAGTVTGATIRTAASGARVQLDSTNGIIVYNASAEEVFRVQTTGAGQIGKTGSSPIVWNAAGQVDKLTANQIDIGGTMFSAADGLLLLGPYCPISATAWTSLRGQVATITGAFHREQGRWAGTRGLVVEEATTNYVENPIFANNVTDGWTLAQGGAGGSANHETTIYMYEDASCRLRAGNAWVAFENDNSFSLADGLTVCALASLRATGTPGSCSFRIRTPAGTVRTTTTVTKTNEWELIKLTWTNDTGGAVDVTCDCVNSAGDSATDLYVDGVQLECQLVPTTLTYGGKNTGYTWSGVEHNSTSLRANTYVDLVDYVTLVSGNATTSIRIVAQMQYDYDAAWPMGYPGNYLYDVRGADDANHTVLAFDVNANRFDAYLNGAWRFSYTAIPFSVGDWVDIVLTLDYAEDSYRLYIDGSLVDTDTTSLSTPTYQGWRIGSSTTATLQPGITIAEYAVFDSVLTAAEVAQIHILQRQLVDVGALAKPGINLIDITGGDLDDIDDGTYGKVLLTSISAGKIVLSETSGDLDDVDDGTSYGRALLTDLDSGHIKLTSSTVVSGEWYDESGVEIDAATGINIYGTDAAFTTRATKAGTIQCKVDAAGKIVAGAGAVTLNATGIKITEGDTETHKINWTTGGSSFAGVFADIAGTTALVYLTAYGTGSETDVIARLRAANAAGTEQTLFTVHKDNWAELMAVGDVEFVIGGWPSILDGVTAPGARAGYAQIYVDTADGDLKCRFGDGHVAVIAADS